MGERGHLSSLRTLENPLRSHRRLLFCFSLAAARPALRCYDDEAPERRWPRLRIPGLGWPVGWRRRGERLVRQPPERTVSLHPAKTSARQSDRKRDEASFIAIGFLAARLVTHPETSKNYRVASTSTDRLPDLAACPGL